MQKGIVLDNARLFVVMAAAGAASLRCYQFWVSQCESTKEMWDTLEVTHEWTNDVKRARKHTLIQEYEMFRMQKGEPIVEVPKRFTHIVNLLMSLGKTFDKEELNIKVLKCLDRSWQPKVAVIFESKDVTSMTIASLFGKLREHKLEMDRLNLQENEDKRVKKITLKAIGNKNCKDSSDESEEETFSFLSKKFSKILKKRNNKNHLSNMYDNKKPINFNSNQYTCFGCGEKDHIKIECPNKERKDFKKHDKKGKSRRVYNDNSSSSFSSEEEEEANLCLRTRQESDASSASSSSSIDSENYSQLLNALKETHEEANKLTLSNNRLKGLNNWLEKRVKVLEEELEILKTDFENLKQSYKRSSCKNDSNVCENCESLEKKIHYLVKTVDKLSKGKSKF
ncbi:uncharacterized protein [Phaseolus vulgaris]|uniref:uncharacterized protein n=1 Tax=Phaseolus vulgaris TaxID=3885 RepID=UPI0035CB9242